MLLEEAGKQIKVMRSIVLTGRKRDKARIWQPGSIPPPFDPEAEQTWDEIDGNGKWTAHRSAPVLAWVRGEGLRLVRYVVCDGSVETWWLSEGGPEEYVGNAVTVWAPTEEPPEELREE